jgi:hypothetical protein
MKSTKILFLGLLLIFVSLSFSPSAQAATLIATGINPDACNQTLSITANVTSTRTGQECIVTFTNSTETIWTVPAGVTQVSAIVVGGGGGGGDSIASATGGGGGSGGFFKNSNIYVSGNIAIVAGAGGSGSTLTSQGANGGTSYLGTLKVGGGGGGNGYRYQGGLRAQAGLGGADFVSSGSGGGARPTGDTAYTNEIYGGLSGAYASSGITFLGNTYTGIQGVNGGNPSDGASGGWGGVTTPSSNRTSTITGSSVEYSKISTFRPWEDPLSTAGTKTYGSGGSPNYGYGSDPTVGGGAGADGVVIIRYTLSPTISTPATDGVILKGITESATVTANLSGKVRFFIDGKRISSCLAVPTVGTSPNLVATCTWKPTVTGSKFIYAIFTPADGTSGTVTTAKATLQIQRRISTR